MRYLFYKGLALTAVLLTSCTTEEGMVTDPTILQNNLNSWLADALLFLPRVIAAMVLFVITIYLAGLVGKIVQNNMRKRQIDSGLTVIAFYATRLTIIIIGGIWALKQVNFDITAFLAGLGILGFTIGFALQDISKNIIAGFLLLIQKPFQLGDMIQIDDYIGKVQSIDLRATELVTNDGHNVLIPNGTVFTVPITNYTRTAEWRINLPIGVAYDSDLEKVERVTLETVSTLPIVLETPASRIHFHTFNDSSIDFTLQYWVDSRVTSPFTAKHTIVMAIQKAYQREGIEIPYPIQTQIRLFPDQS